MLQPLTKNSKMNRSENPNYPPNKVMYFEVTMDGFLDVDKLLGRLDKIKDCTFKPFTPESWRNIIHERKEWIYEHGLTKALNTQEHFEWLGRKDDDKEKIVFHLQRHLDKVIKTDQLIIIDPYFFASTLDTGYPGFVLDILGKYVPSLNVIIIITLPGKVDNTIKNDIITRLSAVNSSLTIRHHTTDLFHDRFWLCGLNERGMFMGASLNGIGKKYCLVDYIDDADTKEIHTELIRNNLF
jgi:hypothetical protein